jgi:HD superfamily phosphohydrolase
MPRRGDRFASANSHGCRDLSDQIPSIQQHAASIEHLPAVNTIHDIPELGRARNPGGLVRIPPGVDVPLTPRVRRLIDTAPFRRLAQISQLGLVNLVYPAANHSRQEHSLGVFLAAIEYLDRLAGDDRFTAAVSPHDAELLLAAALLHDIGHWPFGHPIEDLNLPQFPTHEEFALRFIVAGEIADVLAGDWSLDPQAVADLVAGKANDGAQRILRSLLSGPIDVDKIDYLMRDSLHAGVPYGRHFDRRRLVGSLCLNEAGDGLAITDKGKTAAEMMVFARYVMFSEVYWHHAVRAATAMLQRAVFVLRDVLDPGNLLMMTERPMIKSLVRAADNEPAGELLDDLFGPHRRLYKRLAQYSYFEEPELYSRLARRPFGEQVHFAERVAASLAAALGRDVLPHEVLVDAPPAELEVDFDIEVFYPKVRVYRRLGDVSPVVRTLAKEQFDDYVKRVRIFVHPRIADEAAGLPDLAKRLATTIKAEESAA